jgi:hypothetical protein
LENAQTVVAVNDGAEWIQSFVDYHCPRAVRILDFAHAASYVAQAGKAAWGEESETFKGWFAAACHRLKHQAPQETLANLRLLQPRTTSEEQAALIDSALHYLQRRLPMLDYAHFRRCGYPIGSGSVESGHKIVVQRRMKGAGMRWAEQHFDPMLALRNLVCNGRWEEGWQQIVLFQQEQQLTKKVRAAEAKQPPPTEPITFARLQAAGLLPEDEPADASPAPTPKNPWRPLPTIPGATTSGTPSNPGAGIDLFSGNDAHPYGPLVLRHHRPPPGLRAVHGTAPSTTTAFSAPPSSPPTTKLLCSPSPATLLPRRPMPSSPYQTPPPSRELPGSPAPTAAFSSGVEPR